MLCSIYLKGGEDMQSLLKNLEKEWEKNHECKDVKAELWKPGDQQVEKCPIGCNLEIYENTPKKWGRITGRDVYRQTRICREHGFARIYVITGPTACALNWNP